MSNDRGWRGLVIAAAVLLLVANLAVWIERGLADETRFARTATDALERDDVRRALAVTIVQEALSDQPLLYRLTGPAAERAVADLLGTPAMQPTLRTIAMHLHLMLVSDQRPTFEITSRVLQAIALAVAIAAPLQAATLTFDGRTMQVELFERADIPSYGRQLAVVRIAGLLAAALALALLIASVALSDNRPRAVTQTALALGGAGVLTLLAIVPLRWGIVTGIEDAAARTIVGGVYRDLTGSLVAQAAILLAAGAVLWLGGRYRSAERVARSTTTDR